MCVDDIIKGIDKLENSTYRQVLKLKYVEDYSNVKIGIKMNYSERQIQRIHIKALEEIRKINI